MWLLEDTLFGIAPTRDEEPAPPDQWEVVALSTVGEGPVSNTVAVVVASSDEQTARRFFGGLF